MNKDLEIHAVSALSVSTGYFLGSLAKLFNLNITMSPQKLTRANTVVLKSIYLSSTIVPEQESSLTSSKR
jgi:hypothetical protein